MLLLVCYLSLFFFLLPSESYVNFAECSILTLALQEELAKPPLVK